MVKLFLNDFLFPVLGWTLCGVVGILIVFWLADAISSVSRAADALERIADTLEGEEEDDEEEKGGAK